MTVLEPGASDNSRPASIRDVQEISMNSGGRVGRPPNAQLPWSVLDANGNEVPVYRRFLMELVASNLSAHTVKAYAHDLLRWHRFLLAVNVPVERASRTEVRDLVRWLQKAPNPQRKRGTNSTLGPPGSINRRTGKRYLPYGYMPATINRQLSTLRAFYDYLLDESIILANPVPQSRRVIGSQETTARVGAHRSPMEGRQQARRAPYRQKQGNRQHRAIADSHVEEIFDAVTSRRDWAIIFLALWSGPRTKEILSLTINNLDREHSVVLVNRKGHGEALSPLVVPPVWFEFVDAYLAELAERGVALSPDDPLWRADIGDDRPLTYDALRGIMRRISTRLGFNYSMHDFRHTAATRMANDPEHISLTSVQEILGHASLSTTGRYARASLDDLIVAVLAHYRAEQARDRTAPIIPGVDYGNDDLSVLLGELP